ncbi:tetratricopeptide repeat protein [Kordia sp. YSTF-M3]|uniref:Tetratricopeptide repeat protein n=1 Tax=Kordia aestuariivivens TaxID=2759037 RepID=A0ABR7Q602_9FLAO|nr:toxin-antitoxin system YwqK family antitoxin [Kordia aestuariivivens]MBC8754000.1 tetratricopeptide repeat protein [Kordia aestuariivivens]
MKKRILILILMLTSVIGYCQDSKENILFVVDSIPIIEEPKEGFGTLTEDEINNVVVVTDQKLIKSSGYKDIDKIMYVFTKAYAKRPDSIKIIPSTQLMKRKNGVWCLNNSSTAYSGKFIDYYLTGVKQGEGVLFNGRLKGKRRIYYLNGNVSDEIGYENGISNGVEKRFYEDGTLKQKGIFKNGKEIGVWEMYHPNGQLKQRTTFNENGKMNGESISYYSTGELKGKSIFVNGVSQKDKTAEKIYKYYNQGQANYREGNFKSAIKRYTKCIELDENWVEGYFARGAAKLNNFQFDEAIKDFDKTLEIEPYFTNAYSNRAFTIIRKHEFGNSRTISKSKDIQIMASKETKIPEAEKTKVCTDLKKAVALGDDNWMVLQALKKHCEE